MSVPPPEESRERVRHAIEEAVAAVDSPEKAQAVVDKLERLAAGETEEHEGELVARAPTSATAAVEAAASAPAPEKKAAAVLASAAAGISAPTPEAEAVLEGARDVLAPRPGPTPEAQRGQELLRGEVLRRMGPLQAFDARLFLAVNGVPHPPWLDRLAERITFWATGGWFWSAGVMLATLAGSRHAPHLLKLLVPSVAGATLIVEGPIKATFRRQRPFIDIVRALVVGKRPGSYSFPSGHTASAFAGAWVLSTVWPKRAPLFFSIAWTVGASRVYSGAHYPGDVATGAVVGMTLAETIRQILIVVGLGPPRRLKTLRRHRRHR